MKKDKKQHSHRTLQLVTENAPFQYVEAYKSLRTNLDFVAVGNEYKKIVITSSIPGEGKSNVAINLAISLAEMHKKVLIIDCDLRKPVLHRYLRLGHNQSGLTTVLSGVTPLDETLIWFEDLGIEVLQSGPIPPNPTELLGSKVMKNLVESLSSHYDYIIFDTPPVSVVTDAAVLGKYADGAILVVRQKFVKIQSALLAKRNLETVGVPIIGCVLNAFDMRGTTKDSGYSYSYEYEYHK